MKSRTLFVTILAASLTHVGAAPAEELVGGLYSIQPLNIDGGGQTSSAGVYEISASTAQPGGVGPTSQGSYELEDGFWAAVLALIALEPPGIYYDIRPNPIDGFIDARDLLGWYERIKDETAEALLLFDFNRFWEEPFPPTQK